jgi:hypothetical protein
VSVTQLMQLANAMQEGTEKNQGKVMLATVCSSESLLQTCLAAAASG